LAFAGKAYTIRRKKQAGKKHNVRESIENNHPVRQWSLKSQITHTTGEALGKSEGVVQRRRLGGGRQGATGGAKIPPNNAVKIQTAGGAETLWDGGKNEAVRASKHDETMSSPGAVFK